MRRGCDRVVKVLTAYGLNDLEWSIAFDQGSRRVRGGHGAVQGRAIQSRINLIELLSRPNIAALDEHSLLHEAADLRADLRRAIRDGSTR